jgi:hypothetical protein
VAVTSKVRAAFTEANGMDAGTINGSTFLLRDAQGSAVSGSVSYDPNTMTAAFSPSGELAYGTTYTATLTTGVTDRAGNPLAAPYSWSFTTAPTPPAFIYADDAGWAKSGVWAVEDYTGLEPGGAKILVANDAGATATYAIPAGYTRLEVASAKYWSCGIAEVLLDGVPVATVDLNSEETVWGAVIYSTAALDPSVPHTLTIRATGTGGFQFVHNGVTYRFQFVNVQWLRYR